MRDGFHLTGRGAAVLGCEFVGIINERTDTVNITQKRSTNKHPRKSISVYFCNIMVVDINLHVTSITERNIKTL